MKPCDDDRAPLSRAEKLLFEREADVLAWSLVARLVFLGVIGVLLLFHVSHVLPPGILAQKPADAWWTLAIVIIASGLVSWLLRLILSRSHVRGVGYAAAAIDLTVLALLPVLWQQTIPGLESAPTMILKGEIFSIAVVLIVINSLALYPAYPLLMAGGSVVIIGAVAAFTLTNPNVELTTTYMSHFSSAAINPGILFVRFLMLVLSGGFLAAAAHAARKTIQEAVQLEAANFELKELQTEMALEGRMAALNSLVAGVAHELNTPLGAVRSSLDTRDACIERLLPPASADDPKSTRLRAVLDQSGAAARQGLARIGKLMASLKEFARLDEADVQRTDLRQAVDTVLSLIEPAARGDVEVERAYEEIPEIECRPRELNQVFLTILTNAFEAMGGEGRLRVGVARVGGELRLTFADSGPGIDAEQQPHLFEVSFAVKGNRIGMALGLPTSRRIVERHGGRLWVESPPGQGASFTVALPIEAARVA